jgi:hypothetical protein
MFELGDVFAEIRDVSISKFSKSSGIPAGIPAG